jgi:hypothetical protein
MYQALVVACYMANMNICVTLEDQHWFERERECRSRAFKMATDVHKYMRSHKPVSWTCRALPEGVLTK